MATDDGRTLLRAIQDNLETVRAQNVTTLHAHRPPANPCGSEIPLHVLGG
jgi:hypothetical protein